MPTAASAVISVSPAQTVHYGSPHPPATTIAPALAANHPTVQPIARARLQELNVKTRLPAAPTLKKISAQVNPPSNGTALHPSAAHGILQLARNIPPSATASNGPAVPPKKIPLATVSRPTSRPSPAPLRPG
jgi:hypothetical protein